MMTGMRIISDRASGSVSARSSLRAPRIISLRPLQATFKAAEAASPAVTKPATAPSAWMLFAADRMAARKKGLAEGEKIKASEQMKASAEAWKALPEAQKKPYMDKAQKLKGPVAAARVAAAAAAKAAKKPPSAYASYTASNFAKVQATTGKPFKEVAAQLAAAWTAMPKAEKDGLLAKTKKAKEEWTAKQAPKAPAAPKVAAVPPPPPPAAAAAVVPKVKASVAAKAPAAAAKKAPKA